METVVEDVLKPTYINILGTAYLAAAQRTETVMRTVSWRSDLKPDTNEAWSSDGADDLISSVERLRLGAMGCYVNGLFDMSEDELRSVEGPKRRRCERDPVMVEREPNKDDTRGSTHIEDEDPSEPE